MQQNNINIMDIILDFKELEELQKSFEALAAESEISVVEKKIISKGKNMVKEIMKSKIPKSKDRTKSGRKSRGQIRRIPPGHASDNIPVTGIKGAKTTPYVEIGWTKSDNSDYFYVKFLNWGTTKIKPNDFITATKKESEKYIQKYAENEMQDFVNRNLRG